MDNNKLETIPKKYVTDVIGDDFKKWGPGPVVIDAGTSCGKTTFALNALLNYVAEHRPEQLEGFKILYLCNRKALESDIKKVIQDKKGYITVMTYQKLEAWLMKYPKEKVDKRFTDFCYIIADEFHYFVEDATYNHGTELSYFYLKSLWETKCVIYMSATGQRLIKYWLMHKMLSEDRYYRLDKVGSSIQSACCYYTDEERQKILEAIPQNEKIVIFVRSIAEMLKLKDMFEDTASYYCAATKKHREMDKKEDCIENGILKKRILVTTTVLYNGVDIKDPAAKHFMIELVYPSQIEQAIGRKRSQAPTDTCQIYVRGLSGKAIEQMLKNVQDQVELGLAWEHKEEDAGKSWDQFFQKRMKEKANKLIQDQVCLEVDYHKMECRVKKTAMMQLHFEMADLEDMLRDGYFQVINQRIFEPMKVKFDFEHRVEEMGTVQGNVPDCTIQSPEVLDFLRENKDKMIYKEEMLSKFFELGCITQGSITANKRKRGKTALNKILKNYGFQIVSVRNRKRNNVYDCEKTYWVIRDV